MLKPRTWCKLAAKPCFERSIIMPRYMDRAALKADARESMRQSAVSPYLTALIYCQVNAMHR